MKVNLMYPDRDLDLKAAPCFGSENLKKDLELERILQCMAQKDSMIQSVCSAVMLNPLTSAEEIRFRQEAVKDALKHSKAVRALYDTAADVFVQKQKKWNWLSMNYLSSTFSNAIELLQIYADSLRKLRGIADENIQSFHSDAFHRFLSLLQEELSDEYLEEIQHQLAECREDSDAVLISAKLGDWNQGVQYVLRRRNRSGFWRRWAFAPSVTIASRDEAGAADLGKRRDRAINESANALAQAAEHLEFFFKMLEQELAFYVGCINLRDVLTSYDMPVCMPEILPAEGNSRAWKNLYDVSLALVKEAGVTGNSLKAENRKLYIITGANQGGKSTFLRSIGQAQLMAQCGMFAGAAEYSLPIRNGVFTHFQKEEDPTMKSGKLDRELSDMNEIADHLQKESMILFNESFSATNEREGAEICRTITEALIENDIEVFSVTHLYTFAVSFLNRKDTEYLRAERLDSGERTFQVVPGEPLRTAYGKDLYQKIFQPRKE